MVKKILVVSIFSFMVLQNALLYAESAPTRWYTSENIERGGKLYAKFCSGCHGVSAESAPDWRRPLADGSFPPPPLNGTAHAWHHQMPVLRRAILEGGQEFGGKMPPFKNQLSLDGVDDVIAWFQSHWNDKIYSIWSGEAQPEYEQPKIIKEILNGL